jgi:AI-2 transport protein TqsA
MSPINTHSAPRKVTVLNIGIIILSVLAVSYTLSILSSVFLPLTIALLLSFFLAPVVEQLVKVKMPRVLAIISVVLLTLVFIVLVLWILIASFGSFAHSLLSLTPRASVFVDWIIETFNVNPEIRETFSITALLNRYITNISTTVISFTNSGLSFFSSLFVVSLYTVFFLIEFPSFAKKIKRVFDAEMSDRYAALGSEISAQMGRYLLVKTFVSMLTGLSIYIVCATVGLPSPGMWGLLGFLGNFIPVIGSALVVGLICFMALLQFYNDPLHLMIVLVAMPLIQVIFGNILDPRLQGAKMDFSPSLVLVSLTIWGAIWGIPGMFISVPVTVCIKITLSKFPATQHIAVLMGLGEKDLPSPSVATAPESST